MNTQALPSTLAGSLNSDPAGRSVLDAVGGAVIVVDQKGRVQYRNAVADSWLPDGSDAESVLTCVTIPGRFDGWSAELHRVMETAQARHVEGTLRVPGGHDAITVTLHCTPWLVPDSARPGGVVILLVEDTGQQAVERRLEVSNRLTSLGKLATRVAHELNNPLDGILRYINLAIRLADESPQSKLKSYLSQSRTGLMRMMQIIGDLLEYSRTTDGAFDAVHINDVVEQAVSAHTAAADAYGVVVAVDFQTRDMPCVRGSRLYQVCSNLIRNAIDAMPHGGRMSITTGIVADEVVIRVADTGPGLPEPTDRVFTAFFTTKEPGQGTGLGLAICKDFVEAMGGSIEAASGHNGGAIFTVRLPTRNCNTPSTLMTPARPCNEAM